MLKDISMDDIINFKGAKIRYRVEGSGTTVVLLHGYLESLDIWNGFSAGLAKKYRIVSIDLPGHGKSGIVSDVHTMEIMAEAVNGVLSEIHADRCTLIGHSMGGYVTMAFADLFYERLYGYSLFHSTPFADTKEKRQARDREIEMVDQGWKDLICKTNIPRAFAGVNVKKLKNEVGRAIQIAEDTPDEGIKAVLQGMKMRPDRSQILLNSDIPVLVILGRQDNYIPFNEVKDKIKLNARGEIHVLDGSGHMGFIEEPLKSLELVTSFIKKSAG
jgi:pimeloyl-ACP methyl ester carboxylesterase